MKGTATFQMIEGPLMEAMLNELLEALPGAGAQDVFIGRVRPDFISDDQVTGIEYSCYPEMADAKLNNIFEEVGQEFQLISIRVLHSMGRVNAGEACFAVAVWAGHRKEAREACAVVVDRIKAEVPIWGKEIMESQAAQWKTNT